MPDPCSSCPHSPDGRRRRLLAFLAGALATLLPGRRALAQSVTVELAAHPGLREVGGWGVVTLLEKPVLLVRDSATSVRAVSAVCTHKRTNVEYDPAAKRIECPKHGSRYDLEGAVLKGPSKKALPAYKATLSGERVTVELPG